MATSVLTANEYPYPKGRTFDNRRVTKYGTLAFSNANYFTNGIFLTPPPIDLSNPVPVDVNIKSLEGSGFIYQWVNVDLWANGVSALVGWALTDSNGNLQVCTGAGTTGATEPVWKTTTGATTTDNGATWTNMGISFGTVKILTGAAAQAALTESTNSSAVPAGVLADTIEFEISYIKG